LRTACPFAFAFAYPYAFTDTEPIALSHTVTISIAISIAVTIITQSNPVQIHVDLQRIPLPKDLMHDILDQETNIVSHSHPVQVVDYEMRWTSL
jgi:hypothetical protein